LPLVGFIALGVLGGGTEFVAQRMYPSMIVGSGVCMVFNDPVAGPHGKPNCRSSVQVAGTEMTEYRFNDCGFRTDLPCGPKPSGTFRIVVIGTSFATGWSVPVEKTFADLLPQKLSQITGRNIQIYNESFGYRLPDLEARHFDQVLMAQPDMILWALNPNDIERQSNAEVPIDDHNAQSLSRRERLLRDLKAAFAKGSVENTVSEMFTHTRTYNLLCSLIYASPSQYVKVAIGGLDRDIGYLKIQPSETWQQRYRNFEVDFSDIAAQAESAHIPLVVTLLPTRPQSAMIALSAPPAGFDPLLIDSRIRSLAIRNGLTFVPIVPDLHNYPNPQLGFYPAEGHPNARGHEMFTEILAKNMTDGSIPALTRAGSLRANSAAARDSAIPSEQKFDRRPKTNFFTN
jgi:hypothetical protein